MKGSKTCSVLFLVILCAFVIGCSAVPATPIPTAATNTPAPTATLPASTIPHRSIGDYPLAMNNTWVYQATRYEGFNSGLVMTATSTITETVIEIKTTPDSDIAKIRRETSAEKPIAGPEDLQKRLTRPAESSEYWLINAGNRVYRQQGQPDLTKLTDQDSLELQFPLRLADRWVWLPGRLPNTPDVTGGVFREVLKSGSVDVSAGYFDQCYLIRNGWNTDTSVNWFCLGIGWVEKKSDHNGTPYGLHQALIRYHLEK